MATTPKAKAVYYFCDETSMHDPIMAVGGLAIPDYNLGPITDGLAKIRETKKVYYEVKWSTTRDRRDCGHTAYAEYLHSLIADKKVHLHIRFAPFEQYDHKSSGPRRRVDTTSKMYYQLIVHRALRFYGEHYDLHLRPDNGDCTARLVEYQGHMLTDARRRYGIAAANLKSIQCRDSEKEPLLQLLDVTLGALTALRNDRHAGQSAARPKARLAQLIHQLHGSVDLTRSSPSGTRVFDIWNVTPKRK